VTIVPEWLREHYARVDANDFAYVLAKFADDIEVRFGIRPPATGKDAVRDVLADVHRPFESSLHRFTNVWEQGATTLVEFDVTYTLNDRSLVRMETFSVLEREGGLIKSLRVYIDEGPLRA
jgi:ketosteroid isomerase-like protein